MTYLDKLSGKSLDIVKQNIETLKKLFPEIVREGKIDFDSLKLILGEEVDESSEKFDFTWAGKKKAIRRAMQVSTGTLRPCKEESKNWDTTQNLYIEGDNLEVLRLLQQAYYNRIKMIYIDPPYNTGNDFVYNDDFAETVKEYVKNSGQALQSNPETSGRFHSNWLNMMYPRLRLARNLLSDDGFIFISIDEKEECNLRKLLNEIYGEENYRNTIILRRYDKNINRQFMDQGLATMNIGVEYVIVYSKSPEARFSPVFRSSSEERSTFGYWKGFWNDADRPTMRYELLGVKPETGQWKWKSEVAYEAVENYNEYLTKFASKMTLEEYWEKTGKTKKFIRRNPQGRGKNMGVEHWIAPAEGILRNSNWSDVFASKTLADLEIPFDNPKNYEMLTEIIKLANVESGDIVLDFFSGSASTAHAVIHLNAQEGSNIHYIMVQLPELCNDRTEAYKAGFNNICEIGKERIRRAGDKIVAETGKTDLDIGFKVFKLDTSNLKEWDSETEDLEKQIAMFGNPIKEDRTPLDVVYEIMLKYGVDLTMPVQEEKITGKTVYNIGDGALYICLDDGISVDLAREIAKRKPLRVVFKDAGFKDDNAKLNVVQILKHCSIEEIRSI